ncbi:MAG: DUF5009 domain-containing protein [Clostridium sp.]|nr:DUF5009 domain-containing protein [Clostridium sp.]
MFWIVGGTDILFSLRELFPTESLQKLCSWFEHVEWSGFHFYDMIFPAFLMISGMTYPFSLEKKVKFGLSQKNIYLDAIKRGIILFFMGLVYNGLLNWNFDSLRYASVLGRIGIAWMIAVILYLSVKKMKALVGICVGILVVYWLILGFVHAPDYPLADIFSPEGNIVCYFDRKYLPGSLFGEIYDPEGILSTIPSVVTALIGILMGEYIKREFENWKSLLIHVFIVGVALVGCGLIWNGVMPINKSLWTSSFVCIVSGIVMIIFCFFYYMVDILKIWKWTYPFLLIGSNPLFAYMSRRVGYVSVICSFAFSGLASQFSECYSPLLSAVAYMLVMLALLFLLYQNKIYFKV